MVDDGRLARFWDRWTAGGEPSAAWGAMRIVFVQHASDAVAFYEPGSVWLRPVRVKEPPASAVSPRVEWFPLLTMLRLALDRALAKSVPEGHGHDHTAADDIPAWIAVLDPPRWDADAAARLEVHRGERWALGCRC